jgi:hypothetical protein
MVKGKTWSSPRSTSSITLYPLPPNFQFGPLTFDNGPSVSTIHPGDEPRTHLIVASSRRALAIDEIDSASIGASKRIYVYGIIRYFDVFKNVRTTRFNYSILPLQNFGIGPGQSLKSFTFEGDAQHNEAD